VSERPDNASCYDQNSELDEAQKPELLRRLAAHRRHPEDAISWDEVLARLQVMPRNRP
jgi:putative addiction module component (TIGR02574 family)